MYIEKTTTSERVIIGNAVGCAFERVSRARRLLMWILGEHFDDAEQKPIAKMDAEHMADLLRFINEALWESETEYALLMGDGDVPSVAPYLDGAKRAILTRDVERLRYALPWEVSRPYCDLEDEKLLPILRDLAKKRGIQVDG